MCHICCVNVLIILVALSYGVVLFAEFTEKDVSDIDDESFCVISSDITSQNCLYLFARADREKEEWYFDNAFATSHMSFYGETMIYHDY